MYTFAHRLLKVSELQIYDKIKEAQIGLPFLSFLPDNNDSKL